MSRVPVLLVVSLSVLAAGCSCETPWYRDYDYDNRGADMRGGRYETGKGFETPLPISLPPHGTTESLPDAPVVETPMEVHAVHPDVTPVPPSRLVALMPPVPKGWTAEQSSGETLTTPDGQLTEATRSYWTTPARRSGPTPDGREGHRSVDVTLVDRGQTGPEVVPQEDEPADERRNVTQHAITVGKRDARGFRVSPGFLELNLDAGQRFYLRVRGGNVTLEELRDWAAKVDLDSLDKS